MDKFLGQEILEQERWQFLQDNADAVGKTGYTHRFTPEELAQKKETLAEASITINDIGIEKKEAMEESKERLKPLNEEKQEPLDHIKRGPEFVENEECAKIPYHEEKTAGFYIVSAGANEAIGEYKNKVIDVQLDAIRRIAPDIVIVEV